MPSQVGRVTDQFPPPGSEVEPGAGVTVVVGKRAAGRSNRRTRTDRKESNEGRGALRRPLLRARGLAALGRGGRARPRGGGPRGAAGDDRPRGRLELRTARRSSWPRAPGLLGADVAFPALHGPFGEDGSVQGLLEWLDLPYVGSDVLASAVCMDKLTLKRLFAQARAAAGRVRRRRRGGLARALRGDGLPLWVKPSRLGSSVGISRVEGARGGARRGGRAGPAPRPAGDRRGLRRRAARSSARCSATSEVEASPPGEVVAHGEWYDYETKYSDGGMELVVPGADPEPSRPTRLRELAVEAFQLGGCAGLARCDFFVEPDGEILVNEINTMPGFTETSVYAKLWEAERHRLPGALRPPGRRSRSSATPGRARTSSRADRSQSSSSMSLISTW